MTDPIEAASRALSQKFNGHSLVGVTVATEHGFEHALTLAYKEVAEIAIAAWLEAVGVRTVAGHAKVEFRNMQEFSKAVRAVEQSS